MDHQRYRFYDARCKQMVQWSITGKCNYRCRHCFMSAPHAAQGEPMVRADFWELVDEIIKRDIQIDTIYSNGLLVTDEFLDKNSLYMDIVSFAVEDFMKHNPECRECEYYKGGWKEKKEQLLKKVNGFSKG